MSLGQRLSIGFVCLAIIISIATLCIISAKVEYVPLFEEELTVEQIAQLEKQLGDEAKFIASDGKIPVYSRWERKISEGKLAPDTLLTLAGLASFTADQDMLDQRIKSIIG